MMSLGQIYKCGKGGNGFCTCVSEVLAAESVREFSRGLWSKVLSRFVVKDSRCSKEVFKRSVEYVLEIKSGKFWVKNLAVTALQRPFIALQRAMVRLNRAPAPSGRAPAPLNTAACCRFCFWEFWGFRMSVLDVL
ncbi:hypothetical protein LR48_Vigan06g147000 [Vigna angularis]|uniref:Uncharacterized protein n=1 Tax=Phaseolus angularis TaxID=3914 RepID=A0A0L9UUF3_PHAAN|nr:hypothetical protein LR48_Vigan06g147000 [Vigna angularis]